MKKTRTHLILAVLILVAALLCGCSEEKEEYDVIGDLKDMIFEDLGSQTLEEAANATLSNVVWSFDDTPSYDKGIVYNASLKGVYKEDGTEIKIDFQVTYPYGGTTGIWEEIESQVLSATVDGEVYDDMESLSVVMNLLYGNDVT